MSLGRKNGLMWRHQQQQQQQSLYRRNNRQGTRGVLYRKKTALEEHTHASIGTRHAYVRAFLCAFLGCDFFFEWRQPRQFPSVTSSPLSLTCHTCHTWHTCQAYLVGHAGLEWSMCRWLLSSQNCRFFWSNWPIRPGRPGRIDDSARFITCVTRRQGSSRQGDPSSYSIWIVPCFSLVLCLIIFQLIILWSLYVHTYAWILFYSRGGEQLVPHNRGRQECWQVKGVGEREGQPYWYCCRRMQKWNGRSCGKVPVRLISGTWVATAPESWKFFLVFIDLFAGGARQRQQWHLIPLPTRAGRRWQMVLQCPRLGFVAETGRIVAMDALSTIFLLLCLASYFPYFLRYPGMFVLFVFLRLCSSHLFLSASTYYVFFLLVSFVSCLISEFLCFDLFRIFS